VSKIDVWTLHKSKRVLVTDDPGVPVEACGYVSQEAAQAAQARGVPTVSEIGFNRDDHGGFDDWDEAQKFANEKAKALGYTVDVHSIFEPWADFDDDEWDDDDDFDDYEDDEDMYPLE